MAAQSSYRARPVDPGRSGRRSGRRPAALLGVILTIGLAGCAGARTPRAEPAADPHPAPVREILAAAVDPPASARLRTRIELLDGEATILECARWLSTPAPAAERAVVIRFLAGIGTDGWIDTLVRLLGDPAVPAELAVASNRALCEAAAYRVDLDPLLHFEERRTLVARDWAHWWRANRGRTQTDWLTSRIANAPEAERLDLIRHIIRVADESAVPTLMKYVDTGTLEFRGMTLLAVSYLANTVFLEPETLRPEPDPRLAGSGLSPAPAEIKLLDAVLACLEWWKTAQFRTSAEWVREGFLRRGYPIHDPPAQEDLFALTRALEDPHPAVRSQALRHLILWTGHVELAGAAGGPGAFRRLADTWRAWLSERRMTWDAGSRRFAPDRGQADPR